VKKQTRSKSLLNRSTKIVLMTGSKEADYTFTVLNKQKRDAAQLSQNEISEVQQQSVSLCQHNHGGLCKRTERESGYMDRCPMVLGDKCLFE
jgi:predicted alpha/beta superfamily hydrolase